MEYGRHQVFERRFRGQINHHKRGLFLCGERMVPRLEDDREHDVQIILHGRGKSTLSQHYMAAVGHHNFEIIRGERRAWEGIEYEHRVPAEGYRVAHTLRFTKHEDEHVRVFLVRNADELVLVIQEWEIRNPDRDEAPPVLVASNKWQGQEDENVVEMAQAMGFQTCVVDTLTGEGVLACIRVALSLV